MMRLTLPGDQESFILLVLLGFFRLDLLVLKNNETIKVKLDKINKESQQVLGHLLDFARYPQTNFISSKRFVSKSSTTPLQLAIAAASNQVNFYQILNFHQTSNRYHRKVLSDAKFTPDMKFLQKAKVVCKFTKLL